MNTKGNLKYFFLTFICIIYLVSSSQATTVKTPAEESNYIKYSQHEEIAGFLSVVDHMSKEMTVQIIGRTRMTSDYPSKDLFLCIINEEGTDSPHKLNRAKPTFLLVASQHGNEQSAKEAVLLLIRDLAIGELRYLLEKVNFLVIPQTNPYGNWFDQRRNEQDLDLNRDHVKLEAPEVETIHRVFRMWMPEVTMDVHEKGDDYYRVSIGCVSNASIHASLQEFARKNILVEVENSLKMQGITFHEYLVTQLMGIDSSAGVSYRPEDMGKREMMKRYSTTDLNDGRNSLGIYETLSFIQEGASRHDIETLKERTTWQYFGIRYCAESVARHGEEVISLVHRLREELLERAKAYSEDDKVHLRMIYARDENKPELVIKKFERTETPIRGILKIDKKAGDVIIRADLAPYPYPSKYLVVEEVVKNWFPHVEPAISVSRPLAYIIPAKHHDIVETMLQHGFKFDIFTKDTYLECEAYKITDILPAKYDYLPPQKIQVDKKILKAIVKRGDFYVSCAQTGANLIPCLLEPQSQYGFIRYWKYRLVPEMGDVFPFLRVVKEKDLPLLPYKNWKK
ncbi:MAG: M14 family zinc carboxypeptidase [Candidatus Aminicenantaceae bacterium]